MKYRGDIRVAIHEYGHDLDISVLGIKRDDPRWMNELLAVGANTSLPSYSLDQRLKEGAAEFSRCMSPIRRWRRCTRRPTTGDRAVLALPEHKALAEGIKNVQDP